MSRSKTFPLALNISGATASGEVAAVEEEGTVRDAQGEAR